MTTSKYRKLTIAERQRTDKLHPGCGYKYIRLEEFSYFSNRYSKSITVLPGELSDGATGAMDIDSDSWWVHDKVCATGKWDDGTPINNWQASYVISAILWQEWSIQRPFRGVRAMLWRPATWLFGGGKARENGMF